MTTQRIRTEDLQKTLAPFFKSEKSEFLKIVPKGDGFEVSEDVWTPPTDEEIDAVCGSLRKYANPALIPYEKGAWEQAVVEKYAKKSHS